VNSCGFWIWAEYCDETPTPPGADRRHFDEVFVSLGDSAVDVHLWSQNHVCLTSCFISSVLRLFIFLRGLKMLCMKLPFATGFFCRIARF
jgi:hypothetical protein